MALGRLRKTKYRHSLRLSRSRRERLDEPGLEGMSVYGYASSPAPAASQVAVSGSYARSGVGGA